MASDSVRERIMEHCKTSVLGINGAGAYHLAMATVRRGELTPDDPLPATGLSEGEETVTEGPSGLLTRILPVAVEARAQSVDVELPTLANRLLADVERSMLSDPTRGGLAVDTRMTENTALIDEAPGVLASVRVSFEVHYRTRRGDPSAVG